MITDLKALSLSLSLPPIFLFLYFVILKVLPSSLSHHDQMRAVIIPEINITSNFVAPKSRRRIHFTKVSIRKRREAQSYYT
jgi:hypothetical protein